MCAPDQVAIQEGCREVAPQECIHQRTFRVGNVSVRVGSSRGADVSLSHPLNLFSVGSVDPDIQVGVDWVDEISPSGVPVFDSGATWRLFASDWGLCFDFTAPYFGDQPYRRLILDHCLGRATIQMNRRCSPRSSFPGAALSYPLDELLIMHRLTQEKAIELHSSGIVRPNGDANLFVGHSGAGKSTTTRLWTARENVEVLSDDRIIVRRDEFGVKTPCEAVCGTSEHGVLRLRDCSASRTNLSAQDDRGKNRSRQRMRMYGTPWHGEAMYASPNSAPLSRIFVLEHGHGNVITPLTPSQAVAELFARSFVPFHRHEYVESALRFLEELVGAVPVYRYAFEPDQRAVDKILHFHD